MTTNANETTTRAEWQSSTTITLPLHPDNHHNNNDSGKNQDEFQPDSTTTTSDCSPISLHGPTTNLSEYYYPSQLPELVHWIRGVVVVVVPNHVTDRNRRRGTTMLSGNTIRTFRDGGTTTITQYRILMETMYQYYFGHDNHQGDSDDADDSKTTTTTTTIIHTDQSITVVQNLASFLYRLTLVYFEICQTGSCNDDDDTVTNTNRHSHAATGIDPSSLPPPVWNAYFHRLVCSSSSSDTNNPLPPSRTEWNQWVRRYAPMIPRMVATVVSHDGTVSSELPGPSVDLWLFDAMNQPSWMRTSPTNTTTTSSSSIIIPMQLTIMGLGGGAWRPIFQSSIHGASFTTLTHSLLSYYGPTVLVIETTRNEIFGYYTVVPWKISNRWYTQSSNSNCQYVHHDDDDDENMDDADDESFLFRLHPQWNVYRPQMESTILPKRFHQYLNPPSRQSSHTLVGLAVGGVADNVPRLHITPSFEQCKACIWDSVFDTGPLLSNDDESYFDIFNLEVWAATKWQFQSGGADCGKNDADMYEQGKRIGADRTSTMEHARERYAKVDRTQFLDDFMNDAVLPNKLFQHRVQTRGRADFVVASDNANDGYVVDGKQPSPR